MKKFGLVDVIIIIGVLAFLLVGLYTAKHFRQTADKQIEATAPIEFQVYLRGVTFTGEEFPVNVNEKTFITIRNVPYTALTVSEVSSQPRKILSPTAKSIINSSGFAVLRTKWLMRWPLWLRYMSLLAFW